MITSLEPSTPPWRAVKNWIEEKHREAQLAINAKGTPIEDTEHQRGRLSLAQEFLDAIAPEPVQAPVQKRPRDRSGV